MKEKPASDPLEEKLLKLARQAFTPPPRLSISQWAEENRVLSGEASSSPGQWRNDVTPYLTEIMDTVKRPDVKEIVFKAASQIGKTEFLLNVMGYYIDQEPSPQLVVMPILELAEAFSKDRLAPMIRDCPALSKKVTETGAKDTSNTILHKKFVGGHITLAGANSPASLASRPIRIVIADEIDRMPDSAGGEGNPLDLARKRTSTFYNKKFIAVSSPSRDHKSSKIELLYEASRRHVFVIPCPGCKKMITLEFENLRINEEKPKATFYSCQECSFEIFDGHKIKALKNGSWLCLDPKKSRESTGFFLSALYSPWVSFSEVAREYLLSKTDVEKLKVFYNTYLGRPFEENFEGVVSHSLYKRKEDFKGVLPEGVRVLTMGVDVQDNRLECQIIGYGEGWQAWVIDHKILWGDVTKDDVWENLTDLITSEFKHELGFNIKIAATAIDSGDNTKKVYDYTYGMAGLRVFAIKGMRGTGRPIISSPSRRKDPATGREIYLYMLGVDEAKTLLYQRLKIEGEGPGYYHFSGHLPEDYFKQLTSERVKIEYHRSYPVKTWVLPSGRRNEALDSAVYSLAAAMIINPLFTQISKRFVAMMAAKKPQTEPGYEKKEKLSYVDSWREYREGRVFENDY